MNYPKIIIVGGGFAGLNAAQQLKHAQAEITLLDKVNYHVFQPLLYQVATSALSPGDIALPLREILAKQANLTTYMADVKEVQLDEKKVVIGNGEMFSYDYLILAPGVRQSYFSHPEWEPLAPGLKTLEDAIIIRENILLSFEKAEKCDSYAEAAKYLRFIIIGGGPTGIEMAGAISEIARKSLQNNFRHIKPEQSEIYLIEGESVLLPTYPEKLSKKVHTYLDAMGVRVLLNARVTDINEKGVLVGDEFLESGNVIWAAGNRAPSFLQYLNVPLDRMGRVLVNKDLSIPGHGNVFVVGDAACVFNDKGIPLAGLAPVAIQQGRYVADLIQKNIPEASRKAFLYKDRGTMATVGKSKAVAMIGPLKFSGLLAWLSWSFIHIFYLISFPNRLLVITEWIFWYITNQRRIRLIIRSHKKETTGK